MWQDGRRFAAEDERPAERLGDGCPDFRARRRLETDACVRNFMVKEGIVDLVSGRVHFLY